MPYIDSHHIHNMHGSMNTETSIIIPKYYTQTQTHIHTIGMYVRTYATTRVINKRGQTSPPPHYSIHSLLTHPLAHIQEDTVGI